MFLRLGRISEFQVVAALLVLTTSCNLFVSETNLEPVSPTKSSTGEQHLPSGNEFPTLLPNIPTDDEVLQIFLTPGTLSPSDTLTPTPLPPSATPLPVTRFAVIGDFGLAGDPERDVANLVKNWNPEFIITTGDNNYPDGRAETIDENIGQYFHEYIYPYVGQYGTGSEANRFFPALGNHDWNTDRAQPYFDYFTLPGNERYYDFVWGTVHLFAVDSDSREPDGVGRSSIQAQWLQEKLAASSSPWNIVYMHQPPYASSGDGSIVWAQWPYQAWGVTAVLAGHSHVYERLSVDGFPYFVNGLGGGPRYALGAPIPGSQIHYRDDYGAMFIEATPEKIIFQFITRQNLVIDSYEIQK
jgi:tartrate-resistant acid phosphatase type 5